MAKICISDGLITSTDEFSFCAGSNRFRVRASAEANAPTEIPHLSASSLVVAGDLTVHGSCSILNTTVCTTSAMSITNAGTGPALQVCQTGTQPIAQFFDDNSANVLDIGNAGIISIGNGGDSTPNGTQFRTVIRGYGGGTRTAYFDGGSGASVWWGTGNTPHFAIDSIGGGGASFWTHCGGGWQCRMTLNCTGQFAIGQAPASGNTLTVGGSIYMPAGNVLTWSNGDADICSSSYALMFKTYDGSTNSEKMRICGNGNVGIGITNPGHNLSVAGNAYISSTLCLGGYLTTNSGNNQGIYIGSGGANITSVTPSSKDIVIQDLNQLRFGDSSWDWNCWAGIKYDAANTDLIIGGPNSSAFTCNANPPNIGVIFAGVDKVTINNCGGSDCNFVITRSGSTTAGLNLGVCADQTAVIASENSDLRLGKKCSGTFYEFARLEAGSGYLGIGTTNPNVPLDVIGNISGSGNITAGGNLCSYANITSSGSAVFGASSIDPDSYVSYSGGFGDIADGSGWGARGLFVHGGGTGDAAAIAHNGNCLFFGIQDGVNANSMATWMSVASNRGKTIYGTTTICGTTNICSCLCSGDVYICSSTNSWNGGLQMLSQDGTDLYCIHPDNNGCMYVNKNWYFADGDIGFGKSNPYICASSYIVMPGGLYVSGGTAYFQNHSKHRNGLGNDSGAWLCITGGTAGDTSFGGNVGIGTTDPIHALHVQSGSVFIGDAAYCSSAAWNSNGKLLNFDNTYDNTQTIAANKIRMHTASTWLGGFGICSNTVTYHSGGCHHWFTQSCPTSYGNVAMTLDGSCNLNVTCGLYSGGSAAFGANTIDPDSFGSCSGGFGAISDGSGWNARGLFVHSGITGGAAAIAHGGSCLYFGIQNGSAANSMATWMSVAPNCGKTIWGATTICGNTYIDGNLCVAGNSCLGNGSGDFTHVNDILHVAATDSGDAHFYFGEGGTGATNYGAYWYWDSGYQHTWYSRNNTTNTMLMSYATNNLAYLCMGRALNMCNLDIHYAKEVHFQCGARFYGTTASGIALCGGGTAYLEMKPSNVTNGYFYSENNGNVGLLDAGGSWAIKHKNDSNTEFYTNNTVRASIGAESYFCGNVGIGTTDPAFTSGAGLEIESSTATLRLQSTGSNASEIYQTTSAFNIADLSSGTMIFYTSNAEKMRLNSTGLGIGTSSPSAKLDVCGTGTVFSVNGTNGTLFSVEDDLSDSLMSVNDAAGLPVLEVFADNSVCAGRYGCSDFYIASGGQIGFGTSAPTFAAVSGNTAKGLEIANIGNDTQASLRLRGHNNTGTPGVATYTELKHAGGNLAFHVDHNGTNVITIDSNCNVAIGTTSAGSCKLLVVGDFKACDGWIRSNGDRGWYSDTYYGGIYMTDTYYMRFYNSKSLNMCNANIHYVNELHFYNNLRFCDVGNDNTLYLCSGDAGAVRLDLGTQTTRRGSVYANNYNQVGFLDEGGSWAIRHINDTATEFYTDNGNYLRASIGTVHSQFCTGLAVCFDWGNGNHHEQFTIKGTYPSLALRNTSGTGSVWLMHHEASTGQLQYWGAPLGCGADSSSWTQRLNLDQNGNLCASGSMKAPIFYDSNNTNCYVDPSSRSIINALNACCTNNYFGTGTWDYVGATGLTNLNMNGHNYFWFGAGNGTWFTGTANSKSQASGLAADAGTAHDLLITTMYSDASYDRGITFAVDNAGGKNSGWRLGKWHAGDARDASKLVVDGQFFAKGGYTDEYDYYQDDYSAYYSCQGGQTHWAGDTGYGWNVPSIVASTAIQIQSANAGAATTRKPQIQFHQYGYGGPAIEYDGPNYALCIIGPSSRLSNTGFKYQGNTIWHAGNDGSGSGLDADTVDGYQAANLQKIYTGTVTFQNSYVNAFKVTGGSSLSSTIRVRVSGTSGNVVVTSVLDIVVNHSYDIYIASQSGNYTELTVKVTSDGNQNYDVAFKHNGISSTSVGLQVLPYNNESITFTSTATYSTTSLEHVAKVGSFSTSSSGGATNKHTVNGNTVWHAGNDGSGSGLDADLLDGQQGSYYLDYNNFTNKPTIPTNNNQLTNGAGYITSYTDTNYYLNGITQSGCTLTFSVNGTTNQSFTFGANAFNSTTIPTNTNQLTNGAGYTTCTGTTTPSNVQTFTNKSGNISQWTNDSGYTSCTGDITAVLAGTCMSGGGYSGSVTISHADTSSQSSCGVANPNRCFMKSVCVDGYGHVTSMTQDYIGFFAYSNSIYTDFGAGVQSYVTIGAGTGISVSTPNSSQITITNSCPSDYRLKTCVQSYVDAYDIVKGVEAYKYVLINDKDQKEETGLIAHELQEVLPNAVIGEKDAVDKKGKPVYQEVVYSGLVPTLWSALKTSICKIELLEETNNTLIDRITKLEQAMGI